MEDEPESQGLDKAIRHDSEVVKYSRSVLGIWRYTKLYISATTENDLDSSHWRNITLFIIFKLFADRTYY